MQWLWAHYCGLHVTPAELLHHSTGHSAGPSTWTVSSEVRLFVLCISCLLVSYRSLFIEVSCKSNQFLHIFPDNFVQSPQLCCNSPVSNFSKVSSSDTSLTWLGVFCLFPQCLASVSVVSHHCMHKQNEKHLNAKPALCLLWLRLGGIPAPPNVGREFSTDWDFMLLEEQQWTQKSIRWSLSQTENLLTAHCFAKQVTLGLHMKREFILKSSYSFYWSLTL